MKTELVRDFMARWGISIAGMAQYAGVGRTALADMLNPSRRSKANEQQQQDIKEYLTKLHGELGEFLASGLEQAPAANDAADA